MQVTTEPGPACTLAPVRTMVDGDGDSGVTIIIDAGWVRFVHAGASQAWQREMQDKSGPARRSEGAWVASSLPLMSYAAFDGALRAFLASLQGANVRRIVFCMDGPFTVQKDAEEGSRVAGRFAKSWNLQEQWARAGRTAWTRLNLTESDGFMPKMVRA